MKADRIFRAIGDVGDDLVARADAPVRARPSVWLRWGALAACCVLVVGLAALTLPHLNPGAKTAATADTAVQESDSYQFERAMDEEAAEAAQENGADVEMPAPVESPAPEESAQEPEPAGQSASGPQTGLSMTQTPAEEEPPAVEAPASVTGQDMPAEDVSLPLLARDCAKIELRYGSGGSVTITDAAGVDAILQALRELPLVHEDTDVRAEILTLYLYEKDAQEYYAVVELPQFRVAGAGESENGGEPAQDYCSFDADALYQALLKLYFGR